MVRSWSFLLVFFPFLILAQWVKTSFPVNRSVTAIRNIGQIFFVGTDLGLFRSTDQGVTWDSVKGLPQSEIHGIVKIKGTYFAGTGGGVYRSDDNAQSWSQAMFAVSEYNVMTLAAADTVLFAGMSGGGGVYRSSNFGASWQDPPASISGNLINDLVVDGGSIIAATWNGLFISTDSGQSWEQRITGMVNKNIQSVVRMGTNLFAGSYGGGVYLSTNTGASWTAMNSGLSDLHVYSLAVSGNTLFAGAFAGGVFRSTNNGTSWSAINTGITNPTVYYVSVINTDLFAGMATFGTFSNGGLWKRPLSEVTAVHAATEIVPGDFALQHNFPNPFNPSTTIRFEVPSEAPTTVTIHDILGRTVATIVNDVVAKGNHSVRWNAEGFASGVYFCRLQHGARTATRTLVLQQ